MAASRHLVHWGLMTAERTCPLEERLEHYGCLYDKALQHAPEQHAALYPRTALPCFVPTKDIVIPSSVSDHLHPETLQPEVGALASCGSVEIKHDVGGHEKLLAAAVWIAGPALALHSIWHNHHAMFCAAG